MRFKGLDLNLLVVFDMLMQTRSVSRSAEQLHLSQPGISSALKRLREHFNDEILVTHGKRMFPTAYAETLMPHVKTTLEAVNGLLATSANFDPATSQRTFRLCSSDYLATAVFAPLSRMLATEAPNVRLELFLNDESSWGQLDRGLIDLMCTPEDFIPRDTPCDLLFEERHVIVGWDQNPIFQSAIDEDIFFSAGHVKVEIGNDRTAVFSDRHLDQMGRKRRIEVTAANFAIVPWLLVETQRLALMHERLAVVMAQTNPITIADIPFPFPSMREMIIFNAARAADPGLIWMRTRIKEHAVLP